MTRQIFNRTTWRTPTCMSTTETTINIIYLHELMAFRASNSISLYVSGVLCHKQSHLYTRPSDNNVIVLYIKYLETLIISIPIFPRNKRNWHKYSNYASLAQLMESNINHSTTVTEYRRISLIKSSNGREIIADAEELSWYLPSLPDDAVY